MMVPLTIALEPTVIEVGYVPGAPKFHENAFTVMAGIVEVNRIRGIMPSSILFSIFSPKFIIELNG